MEEKLRAKIIKLIDSIYTIYFMTGFFSATTMLKDVVPASFGEWVAYLLLLILKVMF